jgi:hypothetical protein
LFQYGSHSKKRPNNLVLGRTYDHHIYDLVEVGVENYKSIESYVYDKKLAPKLGSKPFFAFIGEHFESVEELKHLKEVLLDLFKGEVRLLLYLCWHVGTRLSVELQHELFVVDTGGRESEPCWCRSGICVHSNLPYYCLHDALCSPSKTVWHIYS